MPDPHIAHLLSYNNERSTFHYSPTKVLILSCYASFELSVGTIHAVGGGEPLRKFDQEPMHDRQLWPRRRFAHGWWVALRSVIFRQIRNWKLYMCMQLFSRADDRTEDYRRSPFQDCIAKLSSGTRQRSRGKVVTAFLEGPSIGTCTGY